MTRIIHHRLRPIRGDGRCIFFRCDFSHLPSHSFTFFVAPGEILSHVQGTNRYTRMRYRKKVKGLTPEGHFDERHAALYFVDIMHGLAYLHRYVSVAMNLFSLPYRVLRLRQFEE